MKKVLAFLIMNILFLSNNQSQDSDYFICGDWLAIAMNKGREAKPFSIKFFAKYPDKKKKMKLFGPDRRKDKSFSIGGKVFKGQLLIGHLASNGDDMEQLREAHIRPGKWGYYNSNILVPKSQRDNRSAILDTRELSDGAYTLQLQVVSDNGDEYQKEYHFQVRNGSIIGNESMNKKKYMKLYDINRLDDDYVFLKEK